MSMMNFSTVLLFLSVSPFPPPCLSSPALLVCPVAVARPCPCLR